jgi:formylglycine-generating enzyme required for sulfatase activity
MVWPHSQDYNEAVQDPASCFADPDLRRGQVVTNALGLPLPCSGNFADVYHMRCSGGEWAVKCFTRQVVGLRQRYAAISDHLVQAQMSVAVEFQYLDQGVQIHGAWYPVVKMRWVEGLTLNEFVRSALDRPAVLGALGQLWVRMAQRLRESQIAHGDLQHGNILLVPGRRGESLHLRLIDYDGMWVPALASVKSGEVGHPNYQHPQRLREGTYSPEVDRFPLLVVTIALRCLQIGGRALWERYDNGDNLLFREADFASPHQSRLFAELRQLPDPAARSIAAQLMAAAQKPLEQTPLLEHALASSPQGASAPAQVHQAAAASAPSVESWWETAAAAGGGKETFAPPQSDMDRVGGHIRRRLLQRILAAFWILALLVGLVSVIVLIANNTPGNSTEGPPIARNGTGDTAPRASLGERPPPPTHASPAKTVPKPPPTTKPPLPPTTKPGPSQTFKNSLGMEFVLVPKGKSWLGGGGGKPGEKEVEILDDFYLGKYEVTQEEWQKIMENNPSHSKAAGGIAEEELKRFPVEQISWDDAQVFLKKLNEAEKEAGWAYRLPKEAEWEYACRGGPMPDRSESAFHYYFDEPTNQLLLKQANFEPTQGLKRSCKVGSYKANRLGLYDMHGNVSEWCDDSEQDPAKASHRVHRGGSWGSLAIQCSALEHGDLPPSVTTRLLGLRVARVRVGENVIQHTFKNSLGMEFVLVPKGKSWLGGGGGKPGNKEVEISDDFYLRRYEVTQEEWQKVMGTNPSFCKAVAGVSEEDLKRCPVEQVSWDDVQSFLSSLNRREKRDGWAYRLPTEVEWEYACRGGPMATRAESAFDYYLDKPTNELLLEQANFEPTLGLKRTCKVGSYKSNRLGLYDMHGNVGEWCIDLEKGDTEGSPRAYRGGSWGSSSEGSRAADHGECPPSNRSRHLGLRVARVRVGEK